MKEIPEIPGFSRQQMEELRNAAKEELTIPPRIALVGETGVGKTTTLNAMFNSGLETSHVKACTQESHELEIPVTELSGQKGTIKVYDMPGLGEDIDADEKHKLTYKRVLTKSDVAVWILDGTTRHFTQTQLALRDVVGGAMGNLDRLVVGINKVDKIRPGQWNTKYNLPSPEQDASIDEKITDVMQKIGKICEIDRNRIMPYSAEMWYRLPDLLGAMLDACPRNRAWVLFNRANLADFLKKVSPTVLENLKRGVIPNG